MLFSEPVFLFAFLPIVLCGFLLIARFRRPQWVMLWLIAASFFFYGWWRVDFVPLLAISILVNYVIGLALGRWPQRWLLILGISLNLAALGWFKYAGFFAEAINDLAGLGVPVPQIVLPLAISFYTFQQIAFLVDAQAGAAREISLLRYTLFVSFFPQLIAGPIVHHREILQQFLNPKTFTPQTDNLILGLTAFSIGLFKKVVIADPLAPIAALAFGPAADGITPGAIEAWLGAVAFSLQMYFDFSGYSDMAIGLGLMFGIRLPVNFFSPYKSCSIIEFWSRWHMTLTRFLTAYIYNPIVMSLTRRRVAAGKPLLRRSKPAFEPFVVLVAVPTFITFFLSGIWHGAGWQFIAFGLLHAFYMIINHGWRALRQHWRFDLGPAWLGRIAGVGLTFLAVTLALVFFKANSLEHAYTVVRGMIGLGDYTQMMPTIGGRDAAEMSILEYVLWRLASPQGALIAVSLGIVWLLPNTIQYLEIIPKAAARLASLADTTRSLLPSLRWQTVLAARGGLVEGGIIGALLAIALLRAASVAPSEFLYFTF
ncbi:MBOAT family O-acyltransferase [uncultured Ferrovibrio sp.]|jgi:alginate O-acetyltransferase complex protein AlgI|uniref:MBOAT family O-acyltransferase n=1 Tax=uncultured Ferrovibrio sp. TaxID=1576913 RepID=UPI00260A82B1|nr:MBOAT family O-acyltransferase [uncultured Ferrovibrio sp.]